MATHKLAGKPTTSWPVELRQETVDLNRVTLLGKRIVLFQFVDELEGQQEFKTSFGLVIERKLAKNKPRWGKCIKSTADCEVKPGEFFLPENTIEPYGCNINGVELWRCKDSDISLVADDIEAVNEYNED